MKVTGIAQELERLIFLQDTALRTVLKDANINKTDFRYLCVANYLTDKKGFFTNKEIENQYKTTLLPSIALSVRKLERLGYYEQLNKQSYMTNRGRIVATSLHFKTTNKSIYLLRKYTDILRKMLKDLE